MKISSIAEQAKKVLPLYLEKEYFWDSINQTNISSLFFENKKLTLRLNQEEYDAIDESQKLSPTYIPRINPMVSATLFNDFPLQYEITTQFQNNITDIGSNASEIFLWNNKNEVMFLIDKKTVVYGKLLRSLNSYTFTVQFENPITSGVPIDIIEKSLNWRYLDFSKKKNISKKDKSFYGEMIIKLDDDTYSYDATILIKNSSLFAGFKIIYNYRIFSTPKIDYFLDNKLSSLNKEKAYLLIEVGDINVERAENSSDAANSFYQLIQEQLYQNLNVYIVGYTADSDMSTERLLDISQYYLLAPLNRTLLGAGFKLTEEEYETQYSFNLDGVQYYNSTQNWLVYRYVYIAQGKIASSTQPRIDDDPNSPDYGTPGVDVPIRENKTTISDEKRKNNLKITNNYEK